MKVNPGTELIFLGSSDNSYLYRTIKQLKKRGKVLHIEFIQRKTPLQVCECNEESTITRTHARWCPEFMHVEIYVEE